MSPRWILLRDLCLCALGIGVGIVLLVAFVLLLGGLFSWMWLARGVFMTALVMCLVEGIIFQHARRVTLLPGPLTAWHRNDPMQGCSFAILGAVVALGLLVCGGLMEWWLEFP